MNCEWYDLVIIDKDLVDVQARVGRQATELVEGSWSFLTCTAGDGSVVRAEWRQWTPADAAAMAGELGIEATVDVPVP